MYTGRKRLTQLIPRWTSLPWAVALATIAWAAGVGTDPDSIGVAGWAVAAAFVVAGVGIGTWSLSVRLRRRSVHVLHEGVLAHASHAIISVGPGGVIETFSQGAERLFGHRADAVVGRRSVASLLDAVDGAGGLDPFDAFVGRAAENGEQQDRECVCRRADGSLFPSRVSISALRSRRRVHGYLFIVVDTTQAKAAERERREVNLRLAKIASQVPGMVFQFRITDRGRACLPYASDGVRDIFGVEPGAVAVDAKPMWDRVHPEDRRRLRKGVLDSARKIERWQCEFRTRHPDGRVRWLWGNALPEKQPDGTLLWHGFIADVTDRYLAELAHEENRNLLQSILASVDLGVFLVDVLPDADFRFVEVNPAYERLTGISAAEIRGKTPRELVPVIPAEMAACLRASFRRALDAGAAVEYEEPFFVRGRLLWWLTRLTPLRNSSGGIVRLVGRSLDITERKAVELRVQSLTERLQLATEAAQVGIWDYDLVQNRLVCDARMLALYGLTPATFDGTYASWRERLHPSDLARVEQEYREAVEGKKPYNTSFRIIRPEGDEREICARAHVQRNPAGRAVRVVAVHWDVTAERRAQAEIEMARDQAEDLNRQLEDALERAHRLAQEAAAATVAKSEFLANMSHEIRTPLNAIIGMSGFLLGTDLTKEQREFADTIRSSGDGLLTLVNDILDYSKIESGRLELEHRPFDLRQCVESSVEVLSGRAAEKRLDLIYSIDAQVPESIHGDEIRLRQVMVNLLSNAVKFTARGEVYVMVTTVPAQDAGRTRIRIAVHDSGIGIPADRMDRLFKTFSQVDASTTRQFGGTGLGLAISKRIVELMGGRIAVESTAGKGSTFWFEIEAQPAPSPTKPFSSGRVEALAGRRLLVVDDSATACRVLCQIAVAWGMVPRAVSTPAEAGIVVRREQFDVVLIDYDLAGIAGVQVLEELRTQRLPVTTPVVLMTVPGQPRPKEELRISASIYKPVKTASLYSALCEVLHGGTVRMAGPTDPTTAMATDRPLEILVAEDNPVNQRVATLMLQRLGYRADIVSNGREAVEATLRQPYDLVLMDVQMPEMDGLQAAREICQRLPVGKRPRIVAMTANASAGDRDRCLAAGMNEFLSKPVRAEDLRKALEDTPSRERADGLAPAVVG